VIAVLIWLQRDGAIFYGDEREGLGGRVFNCWKFRTMSSNADAAQVQLRAAAQVDGPHFKMTRDPRVTRVGRLLRASNLDELPQLFNVLVGEMSVVGPRPSPFRENQICVPWRNARISVRPGITGLWQVCRHDRDAGDFHQWIEYDLLYVRHLSALVDLKILTATILTLGGKGTHVRPALLVPISDAEPSAESCGVAGADTAAAI
jgi:lipopolysaccharide/colanic/teichoic acid biosynthesis glycosyltransferase